MISELINFCSSEGMKQVGFPSMASDVHFVLSSLSLRAVIISTCSQQSTFFPLQCTVDFRIGLNGNLAA